MVLSKKEKTQEKGNKSEKKSNRTSSKKLKEENRELTIQVQELKDKYLRLFAEFDNYKKRTLKDKLDLLKNAAQDTITSILPVLDDFDRAKKTADDENNEEVFSDGVNMVYNRLYNILNQRGLKPMDSDAELFDPELHDAITEIPAPSDEMKGKIIDTIEKGYYLNEKIIRHAKVVVGK